MSKAVTGLTKKIEIAGNLESVVKTMKTIAASNIGQYEKSLSALADYYKVIELGLGVCLKEQLEQTTEKKIIQNRSEKVIHIVVLGSDQGLVGKFNNVVASFTKKYLKNQRGKIYLWTISQRVHSRLIEMDLDVAGSFTLPTSIDGITPLTTKILLQTTFDDYQNKDTELHLVYNRIETGSIYKTIGKRLLPLDEKWRENFINKTWPSKKLVQLIGKNKTNLFALLREYLFVSIFKACTDSLASENSSRLTAMQLAEKNIEELLESLERIYHEQRQEEIDEELFDLISGFEMLKIKHKKESQEQ